MRGRRRAVVSGLIHTQVAVRHRMSTEDACYVQIEDRSGETSAELLISTNPSKLDVKLWRKRENLPYML